MSNPVDVYVPFTTSKLFTRSLHGCVGLWVFLAATGSCWAVFSPAHKNHCMHQHHHTYCSISALSPITLERHRHWFTRELQTWQAKAPNKTYCNLTLRNSCIFMSWVVCSPHPPLDSSFAIIYEFHVLSGTGRLFRAITLHELTTAHENRWQTQSSAYLFYREKINIANTGPVNDCCFYNVRSLLPLFRSLTGCISENWGWWMWGMQTDVTACTVASVTCWGKHK